MQELVEEPNGVEDLGVDLLELSGKGSADIAAVRWDWGKGRADRMVVV